MSPDPGGPTPSQTIGPFFGFALATRPHLVAPGTPGALALVGRVVDGAGAGVSDAMVELWQADADGQVPRDVPGEDGFRGFGRSLTDAEGRYRFLTVKPGAVKGPGGQLQAPHIDVSVFARGLLRGLVTRVYFPDEAEANATDPVLGTLEPEARTTLVAVPEEDALRFDIRLQGEGETPFFDW
ncbi:MAG TPA: protocatechuate 3,4-dioxygenase subunit alpha [Acidimicrobiales bacterium]|nr:protocatechuate 3,4-dioxygenase subunit alpha [Acidimicrobiales bacterium]